MKRLIKLLSKSFGYEIKKIGYDDAYDYEPEAQEAISVIRRHSMVAEEPLITLFQQVRHCEVNCLDGDFVECGVWKGGAVGLMALANIKYGKQRRRLHLFDAFDDLCEPDPRIDGDYAISQIANLAGIKGSSLQGRLQPVKGVYDSHGGHGTVEIVNELFESQIGYDNSFLYFYKGWFQETLPVAKDQIEKIAILRLDADLYASTKICLEHLYDKVISGGFVIIDDYGTYEGCRKAVDEFRENKNINEFMIHVNHDCRYWIKV